VTRIAFLGDTLLGGTASEVIAAQGFDYPLAQIRACWRDADLLVVNHEGPLTASAQPADKHDTGRKRYWYKGDPASAHALAKAGVRVASLANNHVCDFGRDGLADTMSALDNAGIAHCGAGSTAAAARRPVILEAGGLRIGFVAAMQRYEMYIAEQLYATEDQAGVALLDPTQLAADVAALREAVDFCAVLVHWGRNYRTRTSLQRRLARGIAAAGADLVIGHHPHIPQPVALVHGVPVLYSLGNGAFGSPGRFHSGRPPYGVVAIADVARHRVIGLDLRLINVDNAAVGYRPTPAADDRAALYLQSLVKPSAAALVGRRRVVAQSQP
jgi:poly-gamma-glutamate capsule biosynthesis protein CapA/YwtB (metallophosphatase superfamily)